MDPNAPTQTANASPNPEPQGSEQAGGQPTIGPAGPQPPQPPESPESPQPSASPEPLAGESPGIDGPVSPPSHPAPTEHVKPQGRPADAPVAAGQSPNAQHPPQPIAPASQGGAAAWGPPAAAAGYGDPQLPDSRDLTCVNGHAVPAGAVFCPECGQSVQQRGPAMELVVTHEGGAEQRVPLDGGELRIGKQADCNVSLPEDAYLSRRHARLYSQNGQLLLEDLGSSNGTFLKLARPIPLQVGDQIVVGKTTLRIVNR